MTKLKIVELENGAFAIKKRVLFIFWKFVTTPGHDNIIWTSKTYRGAKAYTTLLINKVKNKKKTK